MKCPNCQSENVQALKDGKLLCPGCDTVFSIEKDGAKVEKTDVISDIDKRISALEAKQLLENPVGIDDEPEQQPAAQELTEQDQDKIPDDNLYPA